MKILMVCLGNICRSPVAEGVLRNKAVKYGLSIEVDSAGTSRLHAGENPDPRSVLHSKTDCASPPVNRTAIFFKNTGTSVRRTLTADCKYHVPSGTTRVRTILSTPDVNWIGVVASVVP